MRLLSPATAVASALAAHAQGVQTAQYCVDKNGSLCVSVASLDSSNALVTVQSSAAGWAAVGFGTTGMSGNAPAYVGWSSGSGVIISKRMLTREEMPASAGSVPTLATPPSATAGFSGSQAGSLLFSFAVPLNLVTGTVPCVYATSSQPPIDRSSASSNFPKHNSEGTFSLAFAQPPSSNAPQASSTANPGSVPSNNTTETNLAISSFCSDSSNTVCVYASRDATAKQVTFTVSSSLNGWVGIGSGTQMAGSTMLVGWMNGGKPVISQRTGNGHVQPDVAATSQFSIVSTPARATFPFGQNIVYTFVVPETSPLVSTMGPNSMIFAASNSAPSNLSNPASSFSQHSINGAFMLDVSKVGSANVAGTSSTPSNYATLVLVHGALMFVAWAVLTPLAIFIGRYMKTRLERIWFPLHTMLLTLGVGGLTISALVCVEIARGGLDSTAFSRNGVHGILGAVIIFGAYPFQILLGVISNALYRPTRMRIPWWDYLHHWTGRFLGLAAMINCYLGINLWSNGALGWIIGYWLWIGLVVLIGFCVIGEMMLVGRHRGVSRNEDGSVVGIGRPMAPLPVPSVVGTSGHWFFETKKAIESGSGGSAVAYISSTQARDEMERRRRLDEVEKQLAMEDGRGFYIEEGTYRLPTKKTHKYQLDVPSGSGASAGSQEALLKLRV
ncbi:hypothetical protein BC830DRAFT_1168231 [Chytriomyces sp. MP71]|nr:hypothetical protein BC830DRAFT_1168231 [Chytriomyces sp. MP71]